MAILGALVVAVVLVDSSRGMASAVAAQYILVAGVDHV
jgi:hypothetical protein